MKTRIISFCGGKCIRCPEAELRLDEGGTVVGLTVSDEGQAVVFDQEGVRKLARELLLAGVLDGEVL